MYRGQALGPNNQSGRESNYLAGIFLAMTQSLFFARLFTEPTMVIPNAITVWHIFVVYALWGGMDAGMVNCRNHFRHGTVLGGRDFSSAHP